MMSVMTAQVRYVCGTKVDRIDTTHAMLQEESLSQIQRTNSLIGMKSAIVVLLRAEKIHQHATETRVAVSTSIRKRHEHPRTFPPRPGLHRQATLPAAHDKRLAAGNRGSERTQDPGGPGGMPQRPPGLRGSGHAARPGFRMRPLPHALHRVGRAAPSRRSASPAPP